MIRNTEGLSRLSRKNDAGNPSIESWAYEETMNENTRATVQKTLTGYVAESASTAEPVSILGIIHLSIKYLISITNLQRLLFLIFFLTYGVGDGVTAAYMIERTSVMQEANPIVQFVYASSGPQGVIAFKMWFGFILLLLVWLVSRRADTYWTINGFLAAFSVGGIMAIRANLMAAYGITPPPPESVIIDTLILTVLFVMIGDAMDKLGSSKQVRGAKSLPH